MAFSEASSWTQYQFSSKFLGKIPTAMIYGLENTRQLTICPTGSSSQNGKIPQQGPTLEIGSMRIPNEAKGLYEDLGEWWHQVNRQTEGDQGERRGRPTTRK